MKKLKFFVEIDNNIHGAIYSDNNRIKQILINLISNAIKYTDRGHITLRAKKC